MPTFGIKIDESGFSFAAYGATQCVRCLFLRECHSRYLLVVDCFRVFAVFAVVWVVFPIGSACLGQPFNGILQSAYYWFYPYGRLLPIVLPHRQDNCVATELIDDANRRRVCNRCCKAAVKAIRYICISSIIHTDAGRRLVEV